MAQAEAAADRQIKTVRTAEVEAERELLKWEAFRLPMQQSLSLSPWPEGPRQTPQVKQPLLAVIFLLPEGLWEAVELAEKKTAEEAVGAAELEGIKLEFSGTEGPAGKGIIPI